MFKTKKNKIKDYLSGKMPLSSAFDILLRDYIDGTLMEKMKSWGVSELEIHIDWLDTYKCIDIQGSVKDGFMNIQIDPKKYIIGIGADEEDVEDSDEIVLDSVDDFYATVCKYISGGGDDPV